MALLSLALLVVPLDLALPVVVPLDPALPVVVLLSLALPAAAPLNPILQKIPLSSLTQFLLTVLSVSNGCGLVMNMPARTFRSLILNSTLFPSHLTAHTTSKQTATVVAGAILWKETI